MKYKKYFIQIVNKGDGEVAKLLDSRLPKQGRSLGEFREIKKAAELLFPKVEVKIISREVARRPTVRVL